MAEENNEIDAQLIQSLLINSVQVAQIPSTQNPVTGLPSPMAPPVITHLSKNAQPQTKAPPQPLHQQMAQTERQAIEAALAYTQGHKVKTAKLLGISRASLYEKMRKLEIQYSETC
ncbi:helix-turn-helix domain-containing protein [Oceanospirillum beijerinckii]|uniref:helix-turn-helix domain-containing protein n=1 Tax=Oceanospirillum beijerinckii TaxID=64976 RepID=UPI000420C0B8|nr:helix-turn-helix domain-containing protein [Oceanospirillum beijerinckii]